MTKLKRKKNHIDTNKTKLDQIKLMYKYKLKRSNAGERKQKRTNNTLNYFYN